MKEVCAQINGTTATALAVYPANTIGQSIAYYTVPLSVSSKCLKGSDLVGGNITFRIPNPVGTPVSVPPAKLPMSLGSLGLGVQFVGDVLYLVIPPASINLLINFGVLTFTDPSYFFTATGVLTSLRLFFD